MGKRKVKAQLDQGVCLLKMFQRRLKWWKWQMVNLRFSQGWSSDCNFLDCETVWSCSQYSVQLQEMEALVTTYIFECRVLRKVFWPKRAEVTREWGRLLTEVLSDLYSPPNIPVARARRMRWTWHLARFGRGEMHAGFWWENLRERTTRKT